MEGMDEDEQDGESPMYLCLIPRVEMRSSWKEPYNHGRDHH